VEFSPLCLTDYSTYVNNKGLSIKRRTLKGSLVVTTSFRGRSRVKNSYLCISEDSASQLGEIIPKCVFSSTFLPRFFSEVILTHDPG
jgi:hypothetical protein